MNAVAHGLRAALVCGLSLLLCSGFAVAASVMVDTGQDRCYDSRRQIPCPTPGQPFFGQDGQLVGTPPAYRDNGDGTVTDLNTGLMWSRAVDSYKVSLEEAKKAARELRLGGHDDWRVPTIKELYSLIDYRGYAGSFRPGTVSRIPADAIPFINTDIFDFAYGDVSQGERHIDAQWLSRTRYVSTTMDGMETLFGVNFADGRIKGYGYRRLGGDRMLKTFFARYVRGNPEYDRNDFVDNGDGTITDRATGLTWMQADSGKPLSWQEALAYAAGLNLGGHHDWRLPNAKELQFIVDYSRSPDTSGAAAIDPLFKTSTIVNEAGQKDFPWYWSSTTHVDGPEPGAYAVYVAFGRAMGRMHGQPMDVHGAGAQRSDPKSGQSQAGTNAPQGDARRVRNYVRCVRGGVAMLAAPSVRAKDRYPENVTAENFAVTGTDVRPTHRQPDRGGMQGNDRPGGEMHGGMMPREPMQGPPGRGGFVTRLDRDGDGRVSRQEFDGPPDRFDVHDRNHDGYLTEDEAPQGPPPGGRGPRR